MKIFCVEKGLRFSGVDVNQYENRVLPEIKKMYK